MKTSFEKTKREVPHLENPPGFLCPSFDCNFKAKSQKGLKKHQNASHKKKEKEEQTKIDVKKPTTSVTKNNFPMQKSSKIHPLATTNIAIEQKSIYASSESTAITDRACKPPVPKLYNELPIQSTKHPSHMTSDSAHLTNLPGVFDTLICTSEKFENKMGLQKISRTKNKGSFFDYKAMFEKKVAPNRPLLPNGTNTELGKNLDPKMNTLPNLVSSPTQLIDKHSIRNCIVRNCADCKYLACDI